ncbi:MAG: hypothetical protein MI741_07560 [Rhodospirillales bacterium]|nr:hypothetical protein [Rhodospirillales bacterium]
MFNIYGRKLPDPDQIARNIVQLRNEDMARARRLAIRRNRDFVSCFFPLGNSSNPRWWISPVCTSTVLMIGYMTRDWSWDALDKVLLSMGFY